MINDVASARPSVHVRTPARLNLAIAATLIAANLCMIVLAPILVSQVSPVWGWLVLPAVLLTPTLWATIHEAVHGVLLPDRAWNDRLGRLLSGVFGSPFQLLRLGHLMHHRFNRSPLNRPEVSPATVPGPLGRAAYYLRLCCGLYLGEVLASLLAVMPDVFYRPIIRLTFGDEAPDGRTMWRAARKQLLEEPGRSRMRLDGAVIVLGLAASAWAWGEHVWMFGLALAGRAFLVSFHDNVYHYGNPLDDVQAGYDLRLPGWAQALLMNFNHHRTHHRRPSEPWTGLPRIQSETGGGYAGVWWRAALRQFEGPIPEARLAETPDVAGNRRAA